MEKLSSFEAAAKSQSIDPNVLPIVLGLPEALGKAIIATYKLFVISQAAWNGEVIDWNNYDQRKYYPWFDLETYNKTAGSVAGFSFGDYSYDGDDSDVGARLVFPTREIATYVGKTHVQLYREFMVIE